MLVGQPRFLQDGSNSDPRKEDSKRYAKRRCVGSNDLEGGLPQQHWHWATDRSDTETPAILSRTKRRLVVSGANDENQNPFVRPDDDAAEDGMDVDDSPKDDRVKTTRSVQRKTKTVPAKHGRPEQRVALSPSKVNAHFKVGKPTAGVQVFKEDVDNEKGGRGRSTPKTPRHRDALSKQVLPVTPRHRVLVAGSRLTTPTHPRTPVTPSQSVYHPVRQLFSRCSAPGKLVGRGKEQDELKTFIDARLGCSSSPSAGCLYVSGPPGTGKSALVAEISRHYEDREDVRISTVNCMSMRNAKDLSGKLSEDLGLTEEAGSEYLRKCFTRSASNDDNKFLVILDEVDRLVDMDLSLLYGLFEWSMQEGSRLILIGIANALDLTDRFLPRLKSRGLKPELLPFMPYTATQIAEILTSKLKSICPDDTTTLPFLHPAAIQFCSKKVASQTGDLRKAFDICRRAIDLVDQETREKALETKQQQGSPTRTPLVENINLSSPPSPPKSPAKQQTKVTYTMATAPKATIAHVAKVTAQIFSNGTTQRLSTLNLQQKAVLCALCSLESRLRLEASQTQSELRITPSTPSSLRQQQQQAAKAAAPTIKSLYESYTTLCTRDNLFHPLSSIEFRDVVAGLEALSLIAPLDGSSSLGSSSSPSSSRGLGGLHPMTPSRTPGGRGRSKKGGFGGFGGSGAGAATAVGDERRVSGAFGGVAELKRVLEGPGGELLREMLEQ